MDIIENIFLEINKLRENFHFSCDVYFDNLSNEFVCKISNIHCDSARLPDIHFRNVRLIDSMLDAYSYLKKI